MRETVRNGVTGDPHAAVRQKMGAFAASICKCFPKIQLLAAVWVCGHAQCLKEQRQAAKPAELRRALPQRPQRMPDMTQDGVGSDTSDCSLSHRSQEEIYDSLIKAVRVCACNPCGFRYK